MSIESVQIAIGQKVDISAFDLDRNEMDRLIEVLKIFRDLLPEPVPAECAAPADEPAP